MVDLESVVRYPTRKDDWLSTVVVGGSLLFGSQALTLVGTVLSLSVFVLVAPLVQPLVAIGGLIVALPVIGYHVDVLRSTLDGAESPPTFADLSERLKDGLAVVAITVAYLIPLVAILGVSLFVAWIASTAADDAGLFVVVGGLLGVPFGGGYAVLSWYLLPVSVALYAQGGLSGTMAVGRYRSIALDRHYAARWLVAFAAWVIGGLMAQWLLVFVVGFFVLFYAQVIAVRQVGLGVRAATDDDDTETDTAAAGGDEERVDGDEERTDGDEESAASTDDSSVSPTEWPDESPDDGGDSSTA